MIKKDKIQDFRFTLAENYLICTRYTSTRSL